MTLVTKEEELKKITIECNKSFSTALDIINKGGYQIALVIDNNGEFQGVIADSDIRKALIKGYQLDSPVTKIMNSSPIILSPEHTDQDATSIMLEKHFFHVPVINSENKIVGLHIAEQYRTNFVRKDTFIVMAGGRGKRLRPLTDKTPKPMLPIQGKPILEKILEKARAEGFINIVISVGYLSDQIIDYFGNGKRIGLNIEYIHEEKPLGTAGALKSLSSEQISKFLFITNADIITDLSYGEMLDQAMRNKVDGLMATRIHEWQNPFGVVKTNGMKISSIIEKPTYQSQVNAGMYVLSRKMLDFIEKDTYYDMPDLFTDALKERLNLETYPIHEAWLDIGRPDDYEEASSNNN